MNKSKPFIFLKTLSGFGKIGCVIVSSLGVLGQSVYGQGMGDKEMMEIASYPPTHFRIGGERINGQYRLNGSVGLYIPVVECVAQVHASDQGMLEKPECYGLIGKWFKLQKNHFLGIALSSALTEVPTWPLKQTPSLDAVSLSSVSSGLKLDFLFEPTGKQHGILRSLSAWQLTRVQTTFGIGSSVEIVLNARGKMPLTKGSRITKPHSLWDHFGVEHCNLKITNWFGRLGSGHLSVGPSIDLLSAWKSRNLKNAVGVAFTLSVGKSLVLSDMRSRKVQTVAGLGAFILPEYIEVVRESVVIGDSDQSHSGKNGS